MRFVAATLVLLATPIFAGARQLDVVYPQMESAKDARASYPLEVLSDSLSRSGVPFTLRAAAETTQQTRSLRELAAGHDITVVWSVASPERDAQLRRIPIAIDRGLIGWRVFLIRSGDTRFESVRSVDDLKSFVAGQGHDWPDVEVLRANGLQVSESSTYDGLFAMLTRGHIDYFPRGLSEVMRELAVHGKNDLSIEPGLLMVYPEALYFYVNRDDAALADAITHGLEQSIKDGSFIAHFEKTYRATLDELTERRHIIQLRTAADSHVMKDEHPELWLTVSP